MTVDAETATSSRYGSVGADEADEDRGAVTSATADCGEPQLSVAEAPRRRRLTAQRVALFVAAPLGAVAMVLALVSSGGARGASGALSEVEHAVMAQEAADELDALLGGGLHGPTEHGRAEAWDNARLAAEWWDDDHTKVSFPKVRNVSTPVCDVDFDRVSIYKYTLASTNATEDGDFIEEFFGCDQSEGTDAVDHGGRQCALADKRGCLQQKGEAFFSLHFITSFTSLAGDRGVAFWDRYMRRMHGGMKTWNQYMHYKFTFYAPQLNSHVLKLEQLGNPYMLRRYHNGMDNKTWYSLHISSPHGKMFEIQSTNLTVMPDDLIPPFSPETECAEANYLPWPEFYLKQVYSRYIGTGPSHHQEYFGSLPTLLPIGPTMFSRNARASLEWYERYMPYYESMKYQELETCSYGSVGFRNQRDKNFVTPVRYVQNTAAWGGEYPAEEFEEYIVDIHARYMGVNSGWDHWMDRHFGINVFNCSLDSYMMKFADHDRPFHAHTRGDGDSAAGLPKDHMWTTGNAGEGIEFRGTLDGTFQTCYEDFEWCTWDTEPYKNCCCMNDACYETCLDNGHPEHVCYDPHHGANSTVCQIKSEDASIIGTDDHRGRTFNGVSSLDNDDKASPRSSFDDDSSKKKALTSSGDDDGSSSSGSSAKASSSSLSSGDDYASGSGAKASSSSSSSGDDDDHSGAKKASRTSGDDDDGSSSSSATEASSSSSSGEDDDHSDAKKASRTSGDDDDGSSSGSDTKTSLSSSSDDDDHSGAKKASRTSSGDDGDDSSASGGKKSSGNLSDDGSKR